ncbi:CotH kinase family protein [Anoxynatronum buryatiense]|uniref:Fn3 associated n=1 Tax=Anoxynatronum buryatiense TaxID=489973 RepID=A0AA45WWF8_9CLOT|nr:CotH kinase family protein [Anoxynatronum buryatiense]SMP57305.1 Fn3 associated [Anoxynatronum buryatiense]
MTEKIPNRKENGHRQWRQLLTILEEQMYRFYRKRRVLPLLIALGLAALLLVSLVLLAERDGVQGHLFINEVMASNGSVLRDEDGDYSDWIELYYTGRQPLDLTGFYLSDDPLHLMKWEFPQGEIQPGGYLLLWASGKDQVSPLGQLHTNFRISAAGESLTLTAPDGVQIIDQAPAAAMPRDVSWGRQTDGGKDWQLFQESTPGSSNEAGVPYMTTLPPPLFSHEGGFYETAFQLSLSPPQAGVKLYYTLDGSEPDPEKTAGSTFQVRQAYPGGETLTLVTRTHQYTDETIHIRNISENTSQNTSEETGEITGEVTSRRASEIMRELPADSPEAASGGEELPAEGVYLAGINTQFIPQPRPVLEEHFTGQVVRAVAVTEDGRRSPVVTHTYWVDPAGWERYSLPVVSVVTDPAHLFDVSTGVYVAGSHYETWQEARPEAVPDGDTPANYSQRGHDWEKPAHVAFYETDGALGFAQDMGIRIHGGWGRSYPQKPLRLYPRHDYHENNRIVYPVFPGLTAQGDANRFITDFNRLLLRNAGNDFYRTYLRDPYMQRLVAHLNLDTQAYRPVVHFVNGEYWGIINLRERFDANYIESHYGVAEEDVVMLGDGAQVDEGRAGDRVAFLALRQFIRSEDMTREANMAHVEARMDLNNFMDYYISQIFFRNTDWPLHNVRIWRKRTEPMGTSDGEVNEANEANEANQVDGADQSRLPVGHDGRWRWMLYDTDHGFGFAGGLEAYTHNTLAYAMGLEGHEEWSNPEWSTVMFRKLLENEAFRHAFITTFAHHLNTTFHPRRTLELLEEMQAVIMPEMAEHRLRWGYGGVGYNVMETFARQRPNYVRQHLVETFELPGMTRLTVVLPEEGHITIGGHPITPETPGVMAGTMGSPAVNASIASSDGTAEKGALIWQGTYFQGVPLELAVVWGDGRSIKEWYAFEDVKALEAFVSGEAGGIHQGIPAVRLPEAGGEVTATPGEYPEATLTLVPGNRPLYLAPVFQGAGE